MARVLIVDDDSQIRMLLKMILELEGFSSEMAADGSEALRMQGGRPSDLILLDFMLPDIDGGEVLEELRRRGDTTPILFVSAQPDIEERAADLDHQGIIHKPFNTDVLVERIRELVLV